MTHRPALVFPVADGAFGLPVDAVREVIVAPRVTAVPTTPAAVLGVCNLRGVVLPVFDTGWLLGGSSLADPAFAVVVRCWGHDAALVVSALPTLAAVDEPVQPSETAGTVGTYAVDERLVTMLHPETLLAAAGLGVVGLVAADAAGPAGGAGGSAGTGAGRSGAEPVPPVDAGG